MPILLAGFAYMCFRVMGAPLDPEIVPAFVFIASISIIYAFRREMKLHYIQNNPDEDDRHFVLCGFTNRWVREDYVYAYPHAWVRGIYRLVILAGILAIAWFFIGDMIIV